MLIKFEDDEEFINGSLNVLQRKSKDPMKDDDISLRVRDDKGEPVFTIILSAGEAAGLSANIKWMCGKIAEGRD